MTVSRRNKHMYRVTKNENLQQNCMSRHLCLDSFQQIAVHTLMLISKLLFELRCLCVFPSVLSFCKKNFLMDSHIKKCLYTLESGINIALRLLLFLLFSRGYGLIPDSIEPI